MSRRINFAQKVRYVCSKTLAKDPRNAERVVLKADSQGNKLQSLSILTEQNQAGGSSDTPLYIKESPP